MTISSLISKMEKALFSPTYISLIKGTYSQLDERIILTEPVEMAAFYTRLGLTLTFDKQKNGRTSRSLCVRLSHEF